MRDTSRTLFTRVLSLATVAATLAVASASAQQYPVQNQTQNQQYPNQSPNAGTGYGAPNAIPEGTRFMTILDDKLYTKKLSAGKTFKLKLAEDLTTPNGQVI